jgi:hypothetical protein
VAWPIRALKTPSGTATPRTTFRGPDESFDNDSADLERVDIHAALRQFVEYLPADKVQLLCMNGSIWARPLFLEAQEKATPAFIAAGRAGDVAVRRWAASEGSSSCATSTAWWRLSSTMTKTQIDCRSLQH